MIETWKPVPGYEGRYEVSELGRVRSLPQVVRQRSRKGLIYPRSVRGYVLQPWTTPSGHKQVVIPGQGARLVHHLVLETFLGPRPASTEARHLDGDPGNNAFPNLVWDTKGNNGRDKKHHSGATNYKLSPSDVANIRRRLEGCCYRGLQKDLSDEYGVSEAVISKIKLRQAHTDV